LIQKQEEKMAAGKAVGEVASMLKEQLDLQKEHKRSASTSEVFLPSIEFYEKIQFFEKKPFQKLKKFMKPDFRACKKLPI
jgi:hypothetical protein